MPDAFERLTTALADRYRVERELGSGGMATVYLAEDLKHRRQVAVKVLHPDLAAVLGSERFLREIQISAALSHPHILTLIDSGQATGFLYYVMPYVRGESLRQKLEREKQLSIDEAVRIAQQVASALDYAHRRDLIHRDIKPENILLYEGEATVADFGIALALTAAGGTRLTETGLSLGTPEYVSPEQAGGKVVDGRSDIYSLGCTLYEMLAGHPPFLGTTAQELIARHILDPVPPLRSVRPGVPDHVERVVARTLEKSPADRFATGAELSAALIRPTTARVTDQLKSIVVLPFTSLSPDPENEYFADGLTEEIITDLSKIQALRVISRTSAMKLKGTDKDLRAIGGELGVQYALEGSVRRAGNSLRVSAQLVDAGTDAHLWAEKYSGTLDDVFDIQEKLSRSIVDALKVRLSPEEDRRIAARPIDNLAAYECYHRARWEIWHWTEESLDRAQQLLEHGLAKVGDNPLLYAALGYVHVQYVNTMQSADERHLQHAEELAEKAARLDPDSSPGHVLQGLIHYKRVNLQAAAPDFRRALAAEPNDPDTLAWLAYVYAFSGRGSAARPLIEKLLQIDPLTQVTHSRAGWVELLDGWFARALECFHRMYELEPQSPWSRWSYAIALANHQRIDEACALFDSVARDRPGTFFGRHSAFLKLAMQRDRDGARKAATSELTESVRWDEQGSWLMADAYALLGESSAALEWLENAVRRGFINYPYLAKLDPHLESVRNEPRFTALMERVESEWQKFQV
ncbi:MAG: protein kinase [Gemmatimonadetes bacterium]|nr:protein kinase [Gemmatimonadota bacterium]